MNERKETKYSEIITTKRMILFSLIAPVAGLLSGMWGNIQFFSAAALLIPQSLIAIIFLVYSIVDAINDPIVGYLTDRSRRFTSKYGKRYIWIILGVIFSPIFLTLCFIPISNDLIIISLYLIVCMAIYETFLTLHEVSQKSLFPDLFREAYQRRKVSAYGGIIGGITMILGALFIPLMIGIWGGASNRIAYLLTCIIIVIVVYLLTIPYLKGVKETEEMRAFRAKLDASGKGTSPLNEILPRILKDRNWMAIVIAFLLWAIAGLCVSNGLNFFIVYYLELPIQLASIPGIVYSTIAILFVPFWIKMAKKRGVKKSYITSMIVNSIAFFLFLFVNDLLTLTLVLAFIGVGSSANLGVIFELAQAEAIDNAAVNSGKREEGTYIGILRIFSAFSLFFQTLIFAIVSGTFGFNAALGTNQTDQAKFGLNMQMSLIPFILSICGLITFILLYRITKEDAKKNVEKLIEMGL